ncbi:septal ring lytic transglycosylase RlpA family protein [Shewanella sp. C32]|uniref:Endolytic peptidoglycan transglycosylase RlpA n=1 Tax=Shewanella electrica TaxID=515560 RepID=A0ABT2FFI6_9GAMM|nr:septal ring lytic transglycosylase RlpA family protein [Shewanella electrica]MCH1925219.1 septal ring lytic transglycosylase RlpA family protein [Shewanella electrica]MCS4555044.1 septal ring lytic transglycosylase RlpA family protein [Shewanella electrica]
MLRNSLCCMLLALLLAGCANQNTSDTGSTNTQSGRYKMDKDKAPDDAPDLSNVQDAEPRYEPYSKQGNKDYEVWGKSYQVMPDAAGYSEVGMASWYGMKFHGHLTSNGETYDMYAMSAAHKSLPLPSYVRVTNLKNNKSAIVRVNDRGPFHSSRILDVSYAAAYKLGMLDTGTTEVKVEVIMTDSPESRAVSNSKTVKVNFYIQVFASSSKQKAQQLAAPLEQKFSLKSRIIQRDDVYRLQLGPINNEDIASKMLDNIRQQGFNQSFMVRDGVTK